MQLSAVNGSMECMGISTAVQTAGTPWRNGSASDSRSEGCVFKSRRGQCFSLCWKSIFIYFLNVQYSSTGIFNIFLFCGLYLLIEMPFNHYLLFNYTVMQWENAEI